MNMKEKENLTWVEEKIEKEKGFYHKIKAFWWKLLENQKPCMVPLLLRAPPQADTKFWANQTSFCFMSYKV